MHTLTYTLESKIEIQFAASKQGQLCFFIVADGIPRLPTDVAGSGRRAHMSIVLSAERACLKVREQRRVTQADGTTGHRSISRG